MPQALLVLELLQELFVLLFLVLFYLYPAGSGGHGARYSGLNCLMVALVLVLPELLWLANTLVYQHENIFLAKTMALHGSLFWLLLIAQGALWYLKYHFCLGDGNRSHCLGWKITLAPSLVLLSGVLVLFVCVISS